MNAMLKKGLVVCAVAALAVQGFAAEAETETEWPAGAPDPKSYGYTALMLGIATPFSLPWDFNWDAFGLAANLGYTDVNLMYGLEFALGANTARNTMIGLQTSCVFNYANRNAYGAQVALVNVCNRESLGLAVDAFGMNRQFYGLSVTALGSMTDRNFYGLDVAGLGSTVREDMWGWQIAAGATFARRVHGLQTAIFNMTSDLRGAQVGLVNWASTCSAGFQVGLVNIIADNQIPFIPIVNAYFPID